MDKKHGDLLWLNPETITLNKHETILIPNKIMKLLCGWTNPFETYDRQNGFIFPNFPGENSHKYLSCHVSQKKWSPKSQVLRAKVRLSSSSQATWSCASVGTCCWENRNWVQKCQVWTWWSYRTLRMIFFGCFETNYNPNWIYELTEFDGMVFDLKKSADFKSRGHSQTRLAFYLFVDPFWWWGPARILYPDAQCMAYLLTLTIKINQM